MKKRIILFFIIIGIALVSLIITISMPTILGLDLVGGSRLVLEAQTTPSVGKITKDIMDSLQYAIENRVNAMGVSETIVQQVGEKRLLIEIPNISDPTKARDFLGDTAQLDFKEPEALANGQLSWKATDLSGSDLKRASLSIDPNNGEWVVNLEFNDKGTQKFADLTSRLVGKPMAIFFNGELKSAPVVQVQILDGHAQITGGEGGFGHDEAKNMVDLLNAGALPVPAKIIEENSVGPTLGADSIRKSETAGIIGISLVMLFMILYYRLPGLLACFALVIYAIIVSAIFKIVPITLTLAGIAGFILSVGMAVDANILIFERTKEELKSGKTFYSAINAGFDRAFTSIFDSNMTTIITCIILYMLGSGIVKGFALTLAIGVVVSMFSAISITKNFMHILFDHCNLNHPGLFGLKESDISENKNKTFDDKDAKFGLLD